MCVVSPGTLHNAALDCTVDSRKRSAWESKYFEKNNTKVNERLQQPHTVHIHQMDCRPTAVALSCGTELTKYAYEVTTELVLKNAISLMMYIIICKHKEVSPYGCFSISFLVILAQSVDAGVIN